jgi:hypothetical protein
MERPKRFFASKASADTTADRAQTSVTYETPSALNVLNGAQRLNDWNDWNWLLLNGDVPNVARQDMAIGARHRVR